LSRLSSPNAPPERPESADLSKPSGAPPTRLLLLAGPVLAVLATALAFRQPPRAAPLDEAPLASPRWWVEPVERNAFARLPVVPGELNRVYALPGTSQVWAVGDGGLVVHSTDGGATWTPHTLRARPPVQQSQAKQAASRLAPAAAGVIRLASFVPNRSPSGPAGIVEVPDLSGLSQGEAEKALTKAGLRLGKVVRTTKGGGIVIRQSPAAGTQVGRGAEVDIYLGDAGRSADQSSAQAPVYQQSAPSEPLSNQRRPGDTLRRSPVVDSANSLAGTDSLRRAPEAPHPTPLPDTTGYYPNLSDVCFATADAGWVAGDRGVLFGTRDGGQTWEQAEVATTEPLRAVACLDGSHAVALGGARLVLRTDNAREWRVETLPLPIHPAAMALADSRTLVAVPGMEPGTEQYSGSVMQSDDGGASWRVTQIDGDSAGTIRSVSFAGSGGGIAGSDQGVWTTADRGRTWALARCSTGSGAERHPTGRVVLALSATDGLAIDDEGAVWRTRDGWSTCQASAGFVGEPTSLASGADGVVATALERGVLLGAASDDHWGTVLARRRLTAVFFADSLHGWVASLDGRLAATTDGGGSWATERLPANLVLQHLIFRTDRHGYAASEDSLFETTDAGRTWHSAPPATTGTPIVPVSFADTSTGWGSDGDTTYVTRNGGRSWTAAAGYVRTLLTPPDSSELLSFSLRFDPLARDTVGWLLTDKGLWSVHGTRVARDSMPVVLTAVSRVTSALGFAIDSAGRLLRTGDGGRNWTALSFESRKYPAPWYYPLLALSVMVTLVVARRPTPPIGPGERSVADLLVSDRPLREGDRDVLDFRSIADGLSRFLRNPRTQPPLTIAVTGKWGTGKSSLMLMLQRDLDKHRFRTVWFNAWHHQREESLLASLLENIRYRAVPPWWTGKGLRFRLKLLAQRYQRYMVPLTILMPILALTIGWILTDTPQRLADLRSLFWSLASVFGDEKSGGPAAVAPGSTVVALLVSLAGGVWTYMKGLKAFGVSPALVAKSVASASKLRTVELQTGFRYLFAQDFKEVTEALKPERLVVFIDDLDRCKPEQVLEILEAVNFLVESGDCVVVMGIDRERVIGCVGIGFEKVAAILVESPIDDAGGHTPLGEPGGFPPLRIATRAEVAGAAVPDAKSTPQQIQAEYARQYLEKLINMEIAIPRADAEDLGDVMTASMPADPPTTPARPVPLLTRLRAYRRPLQAMALALTVAVCFFAGLRGWWPWTSRPVPAEATVVVAPALPDSGAAAGNVGGDTGTHHAEPFQVRHTPIELIPGAPSRRTWWPLALGLVLTLSLMAWLLIPVEPSQVHDSPAFSQALKSWSPVLYSSLRTPRSAKKFLNRVRYLAMLQRKAPPPSAPIDRVLTWVGERSASVRAILARLFPRRPPPTEAASEKIPENVLVALSVIRETRPAWLTDTTFWSSGLSQYVTQADGTLPSNLRAALEKVEDVSQFDKYQQEWLKISGGVRTG
jgi:photosystem II stability/assembly factor-like uncharacterized protein